MKIELGLLQSSVARRIFSLFVLSALIPITITAAISYLHVTNTIVEQTQTQLVQFSKSYGNTLLERLKIVEIEIYRIALDLEAPIGPTDISNLKFDLQHWFQALYVINADGTINTLLGSSELDQRFQLIGEDPGKSELKILPNPQSEQQPLLFLVVQINRPAPGDNNSQLVAQLNHEYLWGHPEDLPLGNEVCILSSENQTLHCSKPVTTHLLQQYGEGHSGLFQWHYADESYLAAYRELFLHSQFYYPHFTIITFQPINNALRAVAVFNYLFPIMIFAVILMVLFLSIHQIRKYLTPLEQLTNSTRQLAEENIFSPVTANSKDEFGELSRSFNHMAARLQQQLLTLNILSQVDRLILTNPDLHSLVDTILFHIPAIAPCDFATIVVPEPEPGNRTRLYIRDYRQAQKTIAELSLPDKHLMQSIQNNRQPFAAVLRNNNEPHLQALAELGASHCHIIPAMQNNQPIALLILAYQNEAKHYQDILTHAQDLTDRIAVALTAWERDYQLHKQAHFDPLTQLPNRWQLMKLLNQTIIEHQQQQQKLAILFVDLDRFKDINDSLGHSAGDQLLQITAQRIKNCVGPGAIVARLGGDEFNIALPNLASPYIVEQVANKITIALKQPFKIQQQKQFLSASIGIAIYPDNGNNAEELQRNADIAMYHAKRQERGSYVFFQDDMDTALMERIRLEHDLHNAISRQEFSLVFQPRLDIAANKIICAEVLLRWHHPELGLISPEIFIPVAEELGLIHDIGQWVLQCACIQYNKWQANGFSLDSLAINVSPRQFERAEFSYHVATCLRNSAMQAHQLELEITEGLFIRHDNTSVNTNITQLHKLGIKIAIDDFGTGYSALNYLAKFPVDVLKIDRSFVEYIPADKNATTLVKSIIAMATSLRKTIVIEGIETAQQMTFAQHSGINQVQGFFLSPPLSATDFINFYQYYNTHGKVPQSDPALVAQA